MNEKRLSPTWNLSVPALRGFVVHVRNVLPNADLALMGGLLEKVFARQDVYDVIFDALDEECGRVAALQLGAVGVAQAQQPSPEAVPNPDQYLEGEE